MRLWKKAQKNARNFATFHFCWIQYTTQARNVHQNPLVYATKMGIAFIFSCLGHRTYLNCCLPSGRQHTILHVTAFSCPFPQSFARSMYCRNLDQASVCLSIRGIISFRFLCNMRGQVQQHFVLHTQDSFDVLCVQKYKYLKKSSKYGCISFF